MRLPELPEHPVEFEAEARVRAPGGVSGGPQGSLQGRVLLGGPVAFPMNAKRYPDMRSYLESDKDHRYHEVHLSLSFADPDDGPRLHSVMVGVTLSAPAPAEPPIAWSLAPSLIDDPSKRDLRIELRPQLKLAGVEVSAGGVTGSLPRAREPFLLALRELRSDPGWELRRTKGLPLEGKQRLVMIVRGDRKADTTLGLEVTATTRSSVLRRYRAVADPLRLSADL
ncbi:hypothetical protein AGRA3207_000868 [Actinomadura graeca]|uniref:Uncharacterized protein n=1 Tax=Actinomadura graeca TaxID=2750812 RepID=A0ABX8QN50_9ACTN|nr:hypothetical protein [Actinomadura graeca]QXJ20196.1 hypothetical protein AGRA3207_000868 [Actinomadura graeca]